MFEVKILGTDRKQCLGEFGLFPHKHVAFVYTDKTKKNVRINIKINDS